MNNQKKRILALLVAMAFTVGSQAQIFGLGGEAEGSATRSNGSDFFNGMIGSSWNGMDGGGNGASWNSMEDATTPVGDGLLLLAVSGMCYAAAKNRKKSKIQ